jgi:hypothetical protein
MNTKTEVKRRLICEYRYDERLKTKIEESTRRIFPDEIVLGNLVIMRFSVHLCQRKFLNKHLRFSIHVSHVSFIPPLVVKSYVPCISYTRTFPVLVVMSPVHTIHVFVHPIYA